MGFGSSSGRCAPSRHLAESHPQVLIIALRALAAELIQAAEVLDRLTALPPTTLVQRTSPPGCAAGTPSQDELWRARQDRVKTSPSLLVYSEVQDVRDVGEGAD